MKQEIMRNYLNNKHLAYLYVNVRVVLGNDQAMNYTATCSSLFKTDTGEFMSPVDFHLELEHMALLCDTMDENNNSDFELNIKQQVAFMKRHRELFVLQNTVGIKSFTITKIIK